MILTERTYVNSDRSKVVAEGSSEAAFLLGLAGDEVPDDEANRLGLGDAKPKGKAKASEAEEQPAGGLHGAKG